jgi:hypothetical protein
MFARSTRKMLAVNTTGQHNTLGGSKYMSLEIATIAALSTNDMICHLPFEPRFFGVGLLAMTGSAEY